MQHKPLYYRYAYSPSTEDVTLSHNNESEFTRRYHHVMKEERPEGDLEVGYASRQADGWNIMDEDWTPVKEPNTLHAVTLALTKYEKEHPHHEAHAVDSVQEAGRGSGPCISDEG